MSTALDCRRMVETTDLIEFLFGRGSSEVNERIKRELLEQPDGEVARFFRNVHERTRNVLNVNWVALSEREREANDGGPTLKTE